MDAIHAVQDTPDPKQGKRRAQSRVAYPYFDLASCIEVAAVIHNRAGGICDLPQLAAFLGYSGVSNGAFRSRISATKQFGLIEDVEGNRLRVTRRGTAIVAPVSDQAAAAARVEAFVGVDFFNRVYNRFNGANLPAEAGLRNLFEQEYGVVSERVAPTVRVFLDSAEQAGFFDVTGNRTRMVRPVNVGNGSEAPASAGAEQEPPAPPQEQPGLRFGGGGGGGNGTGDGGGPSIDPALRGLLERLPPVGEQLGPKRRKALIDAFSACINFLYPEEEVQD